MDELSADLHQRLRRRVLGIQRSCRLPSLVVVVARKGRTLTEIYSGVADVAAELPAGPGVQYRLGSITKTITAVGIMQQVTVGKVGLEQRLDALWPQAPHGELRIADLLSHTSGLQREPVGEVWETLLLPSREELPANAAAARRVLPVGGFWHYSNLAYALLGEVLARTSGQEWERYVRERILEPLGMTRTTWAPAAPHAAGYSVSPYQDAPFVEPLLDSRSLGPAAQLWSTATDLSRWASFLANGSPEVLGSEALGAMRVPRVLADLDGWSRAWGLGLMLVRRGESVYSGHTGSMPGFQAAAFAAPTSATSVAVVCNSTSGFNSADLASEILETVGAGEPEPWRPQESAPPDIASILGRWWSEWTEWALSWVDGQLLLRQASTPAAPAERYRRTGADQFVAESGGERGEELRLVRDESGQVVKFYRATYPFTREPKSFGPA